MIQASAAQHGMWVAASGAAPTAYHLPLFVTFAQDPDVARLTKACAAVAERHPLVSSAIVDRDGVACLTPATATAALRVAGPGERADDEVARPFDLADGPLIRFALFGRTLVVTAHHLVFDGQSKEVLLRDLAAGYAGEPLPPARTAAEELAADAARLAAGRAAAAEYWSRRWAEPLPVVVGDHVLTGRDHGPGQVHAFTPPVPDLPGLTRFETLLAAVHATLAGHGNPRVTTGVDLSTRAPGPRGAADGVGPFATELPIDSQPDPGATFAAFAAELRATLRGMYPHRSVPLARAVGRLRPHAAVAPVSVSYRRVGAPPRFDGAPADVDWLAFAGSVRGDLQLQAVDDGTTVTARLRHSAAAAPVAARFADDLCRVLAADPTTKLRDLGVTAATAAPAVIEAPATAPAPKTDAERVEPVLAIWRDVFGDQGIGPDDDLFDLGGDSLTATQIIARMRKQLGLDVDLDTFFDHPTVNGVVHAARAR